MTKKQLKAYRDILEEKQQLEERLQELEATKYDPKTPTPGTGPGGSGGKSDPTGSRVLQLDELARVYRQKIEQLTAAQLEVEKAIETLEPRERRLVRLYYLDGLTWEQVCVAMCYSWRQVHRIHSAALEKLRDI